MNKRLKLITAISPIFILFGGLSYMFGVWFIFFIPFYVTLIVAFASWMIWGLQYLEGEIGKLKRNIKFYINERRRGD